MRKHILLILSALVVACGNNNTPSGPKQDTTYATTFNSGRIEDYGFYYAAEGVDQRVMALDLYSEGLKLNLNGKMEGSGTNLYFSDIFIPDSCTTLPAGTYTSDTTAAPFTFLPGKNYEGSINGAYLLLIEEAKLVQYNILPSGTLTIAYEGDTIDIRYEGMISKKRSYTASYRGILKIKDRQQSERRLIRL